MNILKDNLIKILEQSNSDDLCGVNTVRCIGIGCGECPYGSEDNKQLLIEELQND